MEADAMSNKGKGKYKKKINPGRCYIFASFVLFDSK